MPRCGVSVMSEERHESAASAGVEGPEITGTRLETRLLFLVRCKNDACFSFLGKSVRSHA